MVEKDLEIRKPQSSQNLCDCRYLLRLDDRRGRPGRVDVALIELAEPAARGAVSAPDGLNLIALEEARKLVLILRDDTSQRNGQIVTKREVGLAARLVLAPFQNLENELVAFF